MTQRDPNLLISGLSGFITQDGVQVEVSIVRLEDGHLWSLEVINAAGTSTVWDEQFVSDSAAYAEFQRTLATEGVQAFLDDGNVVPFRR